jgi:hypothetical protein
LLKLPQFCALAVIVGHKPQAISPMGRIDGTSRDNGRPAGVADAFQVIKHSVEPTFSNRSRNLLSHKDRGAGGSDEIEERRPEMALVRLPELRARCAERLAGSASGPDWSVIGPPCEQECVAPSSKPGEEVSLGKASDVIRCNIDN